jgi:chaperonin cofactor prefoldin
MKEEERTEILEEAKNFKSNGDIFVKVAKESTNKEVKFSYEQIAKSFYAWGNRLAAIGKNNTVNGK